MTSFEISIRDHGPKSHPLGQGIFRSVTLKALILMTSTPVKLSRRRDQRQKLASNRSGPLVEASKEPETGSRSLPNSSRKELVSQPLLFHIALTTQGHGPFRSSLPNALSGFAYSLRLRQETLLREDTRPMFRGSDGRARRLAVLGALPRLLQLTSCTQNDTTYPLVCRFKSSGY